MKPKRILLGVAAGIAVFVAGMWVLHQTLGNNQPTTYHGQTLDDWNAQIYSKDAAVSNQANATLNREIIPWLTGQMVHDTKDFGPRVFLVNAINNLNLFDTGIAYSDAGGRRGEAAGELGEFGPAASAAIPALMQAVQSSDDAVHEPAIQALGKIHGQPETVIPLLIKYLDDDNLNDEAATALGNYGSLARAAVPKIIPLLHAPDDDAQLAAAEALQKIDPAAYALATNTPATNAPAMETNPPPTVAHLIPVLKNN